MPKRNLDTVRDLLLRAEAMPLDEGEFVYGFVDLMDAISDDEAYHLILMRDAGLVEGKDVSLGLFRITSLGHDYIDAVRDEGIWEKTKDAVAESGGNAAFEMLKAVATAFAKKKIEQHTGLEL